MERHSANGQEESSLVKMVSQLGRTMANIKSHLNNVFEIEELNDYQRILRINGKYLKKYKPILQEIKIIQE